MTISHPSSEVHTVSWTLPVEMNVTIGRADEIAALAVLLRREDVRLLTLTGPGGVGKTRLALEVARALAAEFQDGACFVSLAPLREPELVLPAIAQALGIEEVAHQSLLEMLRAYVREKALLLLLDNFEHVLAAGPLLADLLTLAPHLKVLATSREALHLYGEREFEVLPLPLPDLAAQGKDALSSIASAAVTLFVERAQAVRPSFALTEENARAVAEICVQLDGLPLAIELAAARIKLLTPQAILARLQSRLSFLTGGARNLPARQQTLRKTLDWSYDLLSEGEQRFFRQLGVLVGNWTLEAAAAIGAADGVDEDGTLELLTSLVDKSLVRVVEAAPGETRFMLLETIREYALDSLEKHDEREQAQRRHAQFYLQLAEEVEPELYGGGQRAALARLDRETGNLRAAMRWVIAAEEVELALRLASALGGFLQVRGSLNEGHNWLEEVLALSEASPLLALRARVLYASGVMAHMRNDLALARARHEESRRLAAQVGARRTQALASGALAMLELYLGNSEAARSFAEAGSVILKESDDRWARGTLHSIHGQIESRLCNFDRARTRFHISLMLLREVGDLNGQASVQVHLGNIMRLQGKLKTAHFLYTRALSLFQESGDRWSQSICLTGIGDILRLQGNYEAARARFEECLALTAMLGNRQIQAVALTGLGQIAIYENDMRQAARSLKESLRLVREIGHMPGITQLLLGLGDLERYQGNYEAATAYYEQCLALTREINDRVSMSGALFGLGDIARAREDTAQACILLKQSLQLASEVGDRLGLLSTLETFAWLCRQIGLPERAAQFLGTVEGLRDWMQIPLPPTFFTRHDHEVATLRETLGEHAFNESWAYGRTMTLKLALSMVARISVPAQDETPAASQRPAYPAGLTAREVDVLRLVAQGLPDARIAEQLVLSPRTVNTHLRSIYAKIGVSSRSAATRFAFEHGLANSRNIS